MWRGEKKLIMVTIKIMGRGWHFNVKFYSWIFFLFLLLLTEKYLHKLSTRYICDRVWIIFEGQSRGNKMYTCVWNGLFHYSASLPWMSHPAGSSLDKTMPSQGIALQRQKGLASIHRNIGMPPCYFIHIKD